MNEFINFIHAIFGANPDWKQVMLISLSPVFVIAFGIELWVMKRRGRLEQFRLGDIIANLGLGGSYQVFELGAHALITGTAAMWLYQFRLFDIPVNAWTVVPIFIAVEFCYYWFHRSSHRIRWFWTAHVVHHSSEHMNMTTAMRQSLLYSITGWWLFFMPLVLLGVHPAAVFLLYAVDLAYQYWIHTESIGKLPRWIEYIFDTPSNHRVHHGRNPEYIDKNYGGVLIIFDRWFGTYAEEQEKVDYGIVNQIHSNNILTLNFHEFIAMWRNVLKPGPLTQRIKHLWAPPEWERADDVSAVPDTVISGERQ